MKLLLFFPEELWRGRGFCAVGFREGQHAGFRSAAARHGRDRGGHVAFEGGMMGLGVGGIMRLSKRWVMESDGVGFDRGEPEK